jgi:hypothetical protein
MPSVNPVKALGLYVDRFPSQKEAAKALGISPTYLNDLLYARRDCSQPILEKLGLTRVVIKAATRQTRSLVKRSPRKER